MKASRLAAFLLGLATLAALPVLAQKFGTEKNLYPHTVASISLNPIVHASGNNVYVAFADTTSVSDIYLKVSTDNGSSFGPLIKASNDNSHPNIEPVVVGDGVNVHVFWTDDVAGENPAGANQNIGRIFYARGTQSGNSVTFAAPVVLVSQPGYSRVTSALINGPRVHLVFYDNRAIPGFSIAGHVFHMLSCNGGVSWTTEVNVNQFDGDVDNEQPRLAQLSSGEIFLTFRSSRGGLPQGGWPPFQIELLRMNSAGCSGTTNTTTWNFPAQRLSRGTDVDQGGNYAANIFTGASGGLHAAWWNDTAGTNLVYRYGKPNGAGFGAPQNLSGFGLNHLQWARMMERTGMGVGEDATGQVHAIFLQNSSLRGDGINTSFEVGNIWYDCSVSPGSGFIAKQIMGGTSLASEPRAFYSNNRLHVVWMDFRNTAIDHSEIFYNFVNTAVACTAFVPPGSAPARFIPVSPCRVVDTRSPGVYPISGGRMASGDSRSFALPSSACGIPSNALAYSLNATVVPNGPLGFLTMWPTGQSQPLVSTLNSPDGRAKANAAIVRAGTGGAVSAFVTNSTDLILDIDGYFVAAGSGGDLAFYPLSPCRLSDTRFPPGTNGGPTMGAGETRTLSTWNRCGIPSGAPALSLNYTVVPQGPLGFLTTWPAGQAQPLVSTLNAPTGTVVANAAMVPTGTGGQINVFVTNTTDVIVDVNGYFAPAGSPGALSFFAATPCRVSDTRNPAGPFGGPQMVGGSTRSYAVPGSACGIPSSAQAYSLNATVVPSGLLGYLTLWPAGISQPLVSTLNAWDGALTSNAALAPAGTAGGINAFVPNSTDLILDINGYFAP